MDTDDEGENIKNIDEITELKKKEITIQIDQLTNLDESITSSQSEQNICIQNNKTNALEEDDINSIVTQTSLTFNQQLSSIGNESPKSNKNLLAERACVVCWDKERSVRLPCGHILLCLSCTVKMKQEANCPTCRASFGSFYVNPNFAKCPSFTTESDLKSIPGDHRLLIFNPSTTNLCIRKNSYFEKLVFLLAFFVVGLQVCALSIDKWIEYQDPHLFHCGDSIYVPIKDLDDNILCGCSNTPNRETKCFSCISPHRFIPLTLVGDGICDCPDGSDENFICRTPTNYTSATATRPQPPPPPPPRPNANSTWTAKKIRIENAGILRCVCTWDVYEIEIIDTRGQKVNYEISNVSSQAVAHPVSNLRDGNSRTQWSGDPHLFSVDHEKIQWVELDFKESTSIYSIKILQSKTSTEFNMNFIYLTFFKNSIEASRELLFEIGTGWTNITRLTPPAQFGPCNCTLDGTSGSVKTVTGCKNHGRDLNTFCYTKGGYECTKSIPSLKYRNATYVYCRNSKDIINNCNDSPNFIDSFGNSCIDYSKYDNATLYCQNRDVNDNCPLTCKKCVSSGCDQIRISGIENKDFMGLYKSTLTFFNGREVFKSSYNSKFLYFSSKFKSWAIGSKFEQKLDFFVNDLSSNPENIKSLWTLQYNNTHNLTLNIFVDCLDIDVDDITTDFSGTSVLSFETYPTCVVSGSSEICSSSNSSSKSFNDNIWYDVVKKIQIYLILSLACTFHGFVLKRLLLFQGIGEGLFMCGCIFSYIVFQQVESKIHDYKDTTFLLSLVLWEMSAAFQLALVTLLLSRFYYNCCPYLVLYLRHRNSHQVQSEIEMISTNNG
eukprot:c17370_g1_i1.p1 GENE.c17370_g1_i1~~c17370_g1_i1.p1  ORF type:complete len:841 (-),score=231.00 c17370_g1_i1:31-2532(-)